MTDSDSDNRVIIAGSCTATDDSVRSAITDRCPDTTVRSVADMAAVESILAETRVDCLVVIDDDTGAGDAAFFDRIDSQVVLYTATDPAATDEAVLDAIDTLVQRRSGSGGHGFLAEKVKALLSPERGRNRTQYAVAKALTRIENQADSGTNYFLIDDDGTVAWASAPFEEVFPVHQLGAEQPAGTSFDERLARLLADAPGAIETVTRTRRDESPARPETFTVPTPSEVVHFVHSGFHVPANGTTLRLEVFEQVTTDVNREARADLMERLVEGSKDGLYTLDANGNIDFCNETLAAMTGYDRADLLGEHASRVLADGELEHGQESIERLLADPDRDSITVDMTFETKPGEHLDVSIHYTLLPAADDSYAGLLGVVRDITERKERERELEQYRHLVEVAKDPMYVLDETGAVELCNDAMADIAVLPRSKLVGTEITRLVPPHSTEVVRDAFESLRDGDSEWEQFELWVTHHDGTERRYEATTGALTTDGSFSGCVGVLRDITERDRRADELDLLQQVLGRVLRHNIRSELTVIQCYAGRLQAGVGDVETAAARILASADDLLDTAEKARQIGQIVDSDLGRTGLQLSEVVDEAVGAVASEHPQASYDISVPPVTVQAHPSFRYAVENAVENAVIHTGPDPAVTVSATVTDDIVTLCIEDTGPGIPTNELEALARHEETQMSHATGAGLWLMDWVVARSAGDLSFDSDESGTTVRMQLDRGRDGTV